MSTIDDLSLLDPNGTYSYADYLSWRFAERIELLRGKIAQMSAPRRIHQQYVLNVATLLRNALRKSPCRVYAAPFDVRLLNVTKSTLDKQVFTVVQPDVCVICDPEKLDDKGCVGAPDLVIEVTSPATLFRDLNQKLRIYEEAGVPEYWIIHPSDKSIMVFDLVDGVYVQRELYEQTGEISIRTLPPLSLRVEDMLEE